MTYWGSIDIIPHSIVSHQYNLSIRHDFTHKVTKYSDKINKKNTCFKCCLITTEYLTGKINSVFHSSENLSNLISQTLNYCLIICMQIVILNPCNKQDQNIDKQDL